MHYLHRMGMDRGLKRIKDELREDSDNSLFMFMKNSASEYHSFNGVYSHSVNTII